MSTHGHTANMSEIEEMMPLMLLDDRTSPEIRSWPVSTAQVCEKDVVQRAPTVRKSLPIAIRQLKTHISTATMGAALYPISFYRHFGLIIILNSEPELLSYFTSSS